MPLSTPLFKSEGVINSPPPSLPAGGPALPKFAVLFAYDTREAFTAQDTAKEFFPYFDLNICHPYAYGYTDNDSNAGTANPSTFKTAKKVKLKGNPFVYCVGDSTLFGLSGISQIANSVINPAFGVNYGNVMNVTDGDITSDGDTMYSGRHGFTTGLFGSKDMLNPGRQAADIPIVHGFKTGDTASTTATYIPEGQGNPHLGHEHYVIGENINKSLVEYVAGADISPYPDIYDVPTMGKYVCSVVPFQYFGKTPRDTFPKGILVFGANLPSPDYTQEDFHQAYVTSKGDTASYITDPIYLMLNFEDTGVFSPLEPDNFAITAISSPSGMHTHQPTGTAFKSTATGQKADKILPQSGLHTHTVDYYLQANIRSKKLKAYITNIENTPIANGVIIAMATLPSYINGTLSTFVNNPKQQVLPANWHFCDGSNGTPDLRQYAICVDMVDGSGDHNTVVESSSSITINDIHVNFEPKSHTHIDPVGKVVDTGTPITYKLGAHGLDNVRTHSHVIKNNTTFTVKNEAYVPDEIRGKTYFSLQKNNSYAFLPHRHQLAFVMYNNTIP